jgi:hypothetical protein
MKKRIINIGMAVALTFFATSCGKDFLDVNTDPNNANVVEPELVLPAAISSSSSAIGGEYAILGGIWSQYWTQNNGSNQYKTIDAFNLRPLDFNARWQEMFAGALNDYKYVKTKATAANNWNLNLIATLMQSYSYQVLADLYDQIPFDESLKGDEDNLNPVYASGQQVYDGLITRIDEAMQKPVGGNASAGGSDVIFGGAMNQWVRFGNTLKLKIYLRQSEARPSVAEAGVRALYSGGGNFLNVAAAQTGWQDQTNKRNPLYEMDQSPALNTNQNLKASNTLFSFLVAKNDPRLEALYWPGSAGQKGMEQGNFNASTTALVPTTVSRARITPTAPVYYFSAAEVLFLQAEAAVRGWGSGDAEILYENGVRASFAQLATEMASSFPGDTTFVNINQAVANTLLDSTYAFPASGTQAQKLEAIITQKWVALAGTYQGLEAFLERNRTDIPKTSAVPRTTSAGYIPSQFVFPIEAVTPPGKFAKRLIFPEFERTRNTNTPAQVPLTTNVWWDVN